MRFWKMEIDKGELTGNSCLYKIVKPQEAKKRIEYLYDCDKEISWEYHYSKKGILVKEIWYKDNMKMRNWEAQLDSLGNIKKVILSSDLLENSGQEDHFNIYLDSISSQTIIVKNGKITRSIYYEYDNKKRLAVKLTKNKNEEIISEQIFEYDNFGNLILEKDNEDVKSKYFYNQKNLLIKEENWFRGKLKNFEKLSYDSKNRVKEIQKFKLRRETNQLMTVHRYKY